MTQGSSEEEAKKNEVKGKIAAWGDALFGFLTLSWFLHFLYGNVTLAQADIVLSILPGLVGTAWKRYKKEVDNHDAFTYGGMLGTSAALIESGDTVAMAIGSGLGILTLATVASPLRPLFRSSNDRQQQLAPKPNVIASMAEPNTLSSQSKPEKN